MLPLSCNHRLPYVYIVFISWNSTLRNRGHYIKSDTALPLAGSVINIFKSKGEENADGTPKKRLAIVSDSAAPGKLFDYF